MREATPPLSQYALMAWCLVKHGDNFIGGISTVSNFVPSLIKIGLFVQCHHGSHTQHVSPNEVVLSFLSDNCFCLFLPICSFLSSQEN
jgi:hypothetical protein